MRLKFTFHFELNLNQSFLLDAANLKSFFCKYSQKVSRGYGNSFTGLTLSFKSKVTGDFEVS